MCILGSLLFPLLIVLFIFSAFLDFLFIILIVSWHDYSFLIHENEGKIFY